MSNPIYHRFSSATACLGAVLLLCASGLAQAEEGQKSQWGEDPISVILKWRLAKETPEMQDFVKESRQDAAGLDYQPVRLPPPNQTKELTPEQVQVKKNQLEAQSRQNQVRAKEDFRIPPPSPSPDDEPVIEPNNKAKKKTAGGLRN